MALVRQGPLERSLGSLENVLDGTMPPALLEEPFSVRLQVALFLAERGLCLKHAGAGRGKAARDCRPWR